MRPNKRIMVAKIERFITQLEKSINELEQLQKIAGGLNYQYFHTCLQETHDKLSEEDYIFGELLYGIRVGEYDLDDLDFDILTLRMKEDSNNVSNVLQ